MKKIGITQRLGFSEHRELRSQIDIRLIDFIVKCGFQPIIIPYFMIKNKVDLKKKITNWLKDINLDGIVLSGGDDLGKFILRDDSENILISFSIINNIPLVGICRGMQMIGNYFKIKLLKVKGHVNTRHYVNDGKKSFKVNSYHQFSLEKCPKNFKIVCLASDKNIESIISKSKKIYGCMWHPERNKKFSNYDISAFKKIFSK